MNARTPALVVACVLVSGVVVAAGAPVWVPESGIPETFRLDREALSTQLDRAPRELTEEAGKVSVVVALPRPDGTLARFRVEESPVLPPGLSAK